MERQMLLLFLYTREKSLKQISMSFFVHEDKN